MLTGAKTNRSDAKCGRRCISSSYLRTWAACEACGGGTQVWQREREGGRERERERWKRRLSCNSSSCCSNRTVRYCLVLRRCFIVRRVNVMCYPQDRVIVFPCRVLGIDHLLSRRSFYVPQQRFIVLQIHFELNKTWSLNRARKILGHPVPHKADALAVNSRAWYPRFRMSGTWTLAKVLRLPRLVKPEEW